jgi:hypothetical protein
MHRALYTLRLCKMSPPAYIHGNEWDERFRLCRLHKPSRGFPLTPGWPQRLAVVRGGTEELTAVRGGARTGASELAAVSGGDRPPAKSAAPATPPLNRVSSPSTGQILPPASRGAARGKILS